MSAYKGGGEGGPHFYVGLRGHHADIGGITPVALMCTSRFASRYRSTPTAWRKRQEINADPRQSRVDISQLRKSAPGEVFSNPKTAEMERFTEMIQQRYCSVINSTLRMPG